MLRLGTYHRYGSIRIDVLFNSEFHVRMHSSACWLEHDNDFVCIGHQMIRVAHIFCSNAGSREYKSACEAKNND